MEKEMTTVKTWKTDNSHSNFGFNVKHMMFAKVIGNFENYEASIEMPNFELENAKLKFEAVTASISTRDENRDNHLKSGDFFDAENHPKVTFESTNIEKKDANNFVVEGNLSMRGISKPITLNAVYSGRMIDPWGNERFVLSMESQVNRKEWGLNWNSALEAGGVLVGEKVNLDIETEFV